MLRHTIIRMMSHIIHISTRDSRVLHHCASSLRVQPSHYNNVRQQDVYPQSTSVSAAIVREWDQGECSRAKEQGEGHTQASHAGACAGCWVLLVFHGNPTSCHNDNQAGVMDSQSTAILPSTASSTEGNLFAEHGLAVQRESAATLNPQPSSSFECRHMKRAGPGETRTHLIRDAQRARH